MQNRRPKSKLVAAGPSTDAAPNARRWNRDGPIILAETGGQTEVGEPMPVTCVCHETIVVDPQVRSVSLDRFDDGLLQRLGLMRTERGWSDNLGLGAVAHVIEHGDHTVAVVTSFGEFQPGRDIWAHHGVVEVAASTTPGSTGTWRDRLIAITALLASVTAFAWLNLVAIGGYVTSSELERSGTRVSAEVTELRQSGGPRQADIFTATYRYTDSNGVSHIGEASVDEGRYVLASLSGNIDVAYDADNPAHSAVVDNDQPAVLLGITIVVDLVVAGLIVAGLSRSLRQAGD